MVSVAEAYDLILKHLFAPSNVTVSLTDAVGKVLAEPVYADRDFPPFDRVAMDGIAVGYEKLQEGQREFLIEGIQSAGSVRKRLNDPSLAMEVMTGAVLPEGADVVIKYEDLSMENTKAKVTINTFQRYQNIHRQGTDAHSADELLTPGVLLSPAEIALLASVGKAKVLTRAFPRIAIVSTGNELVDIRDTPEPHQIRRSNSYALYASLAQMGCIPSIHHLPDEPGDMEKVLRSLLSDSDAIVLSGGVSKGKFDYVPGVLDTLGVQKVFHQVSQRPGKPFWFGAADGKVVFALPGNPVSTFLCFFKYIKPWVLASLGVEIPMAQAILGADYSFAPALTSFLQVQVKDDQGKMVAHPYPGGGSGDFVNLKEVTGFLELPAEKKNFRQGEVYPYIGFRY